MNQDIQAVTGAFGYSGKYIAKRLIDEGKKVITITNSLHRKNPFGSNIQVFPFNFDQPLLSRRPEQRPCMERPVMIPDSYNKTVYINTPKSLRYC
jgi:nucleoside-diphosphate-sugar epimerase